MNESVKQRSKKLLYGLFSIEDVEESFDRFFSDERIDFLKQNDVQTIIIESSIAVDPALYIRIINEYSSRGFVVKSNHIDSLDEDNLISLKNHILEIFSSFENGSCFLLSYGKSYTLPVIGCFLVLSGHSVEDAVEISNSMSPFERLSETEKSFIYSFQRFINENFREADIYAREYGNIIPVISEPESMNDEPTAVEPIENSEPVTELTELKEVPAAENRAEEVKTEAVEEDEEPAADIDIAEIKTGAFYSSIRFKLVSIISIIIIASLTGMIFLATYFFKKDNTIRVQENNHKISEIIGLKVRSDISVIIEKSKFIISTLLKENSSNETSVNVEDLIRDDQDILALTLAVKNGNTGTIDFVNTIYNRPLMDRDEVLEKDLAEAYRTINESILKVFDGDKIIENVSQILGKPVINLSFPYQLNENRQVSSIIVVYVRLDKFLKTFKPSGIIKTIMVNGKGDVIAHYDSKIVMSAANFSSLPIVQRMMSSELDNGQTKYKDEKGVPFLGSFKKIGFGGAGIVGFVKEDLALQEVYNIQRRNIYLMIAVLSAAVLIVFFFGKTLTNPIIRLLKATNMIKEGHYRVNIKPASNDEIGQLTSAFIEMGKGLEEREKMKDAFGKFVNKEIADQVIKGEIRLGGERKDAAVFFSDIRSFTKISENLEPEEVVEFLNDYMTRMVNCIYQTGGVVDKYIGDAIMAVWGVPLSKGNDTENAVDAALLMRKELIEFNKGRGGQKKPIIRIGSGINSGPVLAGQIGSEDRMEYTVIGDAVNLASRIESLNKPFGTDILISEDSYKLVKDIYHVEKMLPITVKGKSEKQQIYAVLGRKDDPDCLKSVEELQKLLGIEKKDLNRRRDDLSEEEVKYEIFDD